MSKDNGVLAGFKAFLMRGNVVELAVAVVIGAAFTSIVNAVVKGVINPIVGAFGTSNLDHYRSCLKGPCEVSATGDVTGVYILWGSVISAALTFLMTAAVVYFLMILPMNKYKERMAAKAPVEATPVEVTEIQLLGEIRDLLLEQRNAGVHGRDDRAVGKLPRQ
ncbi:large conductance mechanosensitive channel protein MscL [Streptomyces sp. NPDC059506]|uniref:large conductance mechanosensitive channel protein MscL n=1 Tax=Streptomyces TaxID=1883 RepID=UPI000CB9F5A2|nr:MULTISPECIES: large conductance mechanosensitive channel protein MscL [unclassified Streptomyces]MCZ2526039.1 large conductance mechanosensitive channel protein MscL [Streptomyces sp. HB2AG]PLW73434.1 large conductance mechanosensitive channel protein MscL [Streptomyces sp. DJ]QMV23018.1 large conductance mechanosensitive channel protein MscL [Streptomyces sp. SCUT-3]